MKEIMENRYIKGLFEVIENTIFDVQTNSYSQGIRDVISMVEEAKMESKKVIFIGNGGSAAIATHMTADFMKNGGVKTLSMYDPATLTCLANDYGYEYAFSKQLEDQVQEGDILFAISSSGNSQNIINAVDVCLKKGTFVVSLTGFKKDNTLRQKGTYNIYVPSDKYGIVESIHNIILQQIVDEIFYAKNK